jgi:hypothetical protein
LPHDKEKPTVSDLDFPNFFNPSLRLNMKTLTTLNMKTLAISTLPAILIALHSAGAAAQTTTDEARALAAKATAEYEREAWTHPPVAEPVARGDYRAEAHQRERVLQWQASQRAVLAYEAGKRSRPIAVGSEESARAEAHRVLGEQALAERATELRTAAASR